MSFRELIHLREEEKTLTKKGKMFQKIKRCYEIFSQNVKSNGLLSFHSHLIIICLLYNFSFCALASVGTDLSREQQVRAVVV
jgi:hypothetical protein